LTHLSLVFSFASLCSFPICGIKVVPMTTGGVVNKMTIYFVGELIRSSDVYGNEKNCDESDRYSTPAVSVVGIEGACILPKSLLCQHVHRPVSRYILVCKLQQ
jgi:hypothetical protein